MEENAKKCPICQNNMAAGHKNGKGIVCFNVSEQQPPNVWACENCWHEEPIQEAVAEQ
jgi:hypothetical protein